MNLNKLSPKERKIIDFPHRQPVCTGPHAECLVSLGSRSLMQAIKYYQRALAVFMREENQEKWEKDYEARCCVQQLTTLAEGLERLRNIAAPTLAEMGTNCQDIEGCKG